MNKQRKVLITITYNEMGIIVDTKAEEVAQPSAKDTNVPITDTISRAEAIEAICEDGTQLERQGQYRMTMAERKQRDADILDALPSAQQEIVRCNDCTRYEKRRGCNLVEGLNVATPECFCSYAERKNNG